MAANVGRRWSREELILAFNLYCETSFGRIHTRNPEIVELASVLGRSPGAVSYKLANFARLDPALEARGIRGMRHGAKGEVAIWEAFSADGEALAFESERLLAQRTARSLDDGVDTSDLDVVEGREREAIVQTRVNQNFFRRMVLARYEGACCVTGLRVPELLVASHIVPWAEATSERLTPRNGLWLNALHDRAFDRGLITITADLRLVVAPELREAPSPAAEEWLLRFDGAPLHLPRRIRPDPRFLEYHRGAIFRG